MIVAANLKCNHTRASFLNFTKKLDNFLSGEASNFKKDEILVFPPSTAFCDQISNFTQGAQNFFPCKNGSFTGEIGADMLNEFGIKSVLIGHSERRVIFSESDRMVFEKFKFAKKRGWRIIFCVGESDIVRMNGNYREVLSDQLSEIDLDYENLIIAYEPIWAIGTGKSAKNEQIEEVLEFLAEKTEAPLLYGGSVNLKNISQILKLPHCSGVLIGSASWEAENFINLLKELQ